MKHSLFTLFVIPCSLFTIAGCGEPRPDGFPAKVVPANVTVTKSGSPLSEVGVYFDTESPANYQMGGTTDSSGVAVMRTIQGSHQKNGVPEGTYRVRLTESIPPMPDELSDAERAVLSSSGVKAYEKKLRDWAESQRKIPLKFSGMNSPLSAAVSASASGVTIDVEQ